MSTNPFYALRAKYLKYDDKVQAEKDAKEEWLALVRKESPSLSDFKPGTTITTNNKYDGKVKYTLTEPVNKNVPINYAFNPGRMLELGIFEGKYLNDDILEFPREWFLDAKVSILLPNKDLNKMGAQSRQPLADWVKNDWIKQDKKGWFSWFCRMYLGRRSGDDEWQVKRWNAFARHAAQVKAGCRAGDLECRAKQRQALLQWSWKYDV